MDELNDQPHGRRAMFRLGLKRLFEPVAEYIEERFDLEEPKPAPRPVLRPPGALPENEFLQICYRCGNCVDVCPAEAIISTSTDEVELTGTPSIDPDFAACVICDERACMKACPSGALEVVDSPKDIRMGRARTEPRFCVRVQGESCSLCVDKCPIGSDAIGIDASGRVEVRDGCVGCGVCQFYCPALPKAIVIEPSGSR